MTHASRRTQRIRIASRRTRRYFKRVVLARVHKDGLHAHDADAALCQVVRADDGQVVCQAEGGRDGEEGKR